MLKKILYSTALLISLIALFLYWLITSLSVDQPIKNIKDIKPAQVPYIAKAITQKRGKILAVVTSTDVMGASGKSTGYELTELSRAYYVFTSNGFEVDIASPKGGLPPVVIDDDDMAEFDFAFLNDEHAQAKVQNSFAIADVNAQDYQAVYFIGGKGAMFDFPNNTAIQNIVSEMYEQGKTVAAICHGPAALVNVKLSDGSYLLANKQVSSFTNEEELFLIPDAEVIFPFLLEDKLRQQGARPEVGTRYLEQVSHDGNLITGQNPWSVWKTAETIITQLGYQPVAREISATEHTVNVLRNYHKHGFSMAKQQLIELVNSPQISVDKNLLAMHSILAAMDWEIGTSIEIIRLLHATRT
jgi:putative intracellular protease/amidase